MIGIFDSGIGGLSVWKELRTLMPNEDYVYVADSNYAPYGLKSIDFIRERSARISEFLINKGAEVIVVACNTASAAALSFLRSGYDIPFVGMEPAIKPAIHKTQSGVVGVLATANTFKGDLYHNTLERFASETKVIERVGEGLVELIEAGKYEGGEVEDLLRVYLLPMMDEGVDSLVLGCTHYPFLEKSIRKIVGQSMNIINPAPSVALQTQRIINERRVDSYAQVQKEKRGSSLFYSTGETETLIKIATTIDPIVEKDNFKKINI